MNEVHVTSEVKPRLAFVGVGWIGFQRMEAILDGACAEAAAVADPNADAADRAARVSPDCRHCADLDEVLAMDVDGVVIATPSGLHAAQAVRALDAGKAVFCQKPLGCTAAETRAVIDAARRNDRLLGVDMSYRYTTAMRTVHEIVRSGAVGRVYAVDLVFHNAYGPDTGWSKDPDVAGGGCLIDLGVHLVDLLMWTLGDRDVSGVAAALFHEGRRLSPPMRQVEDHAVASITLSDGAVASLACSWNHPAGCDAAIEASFHGTDGGVTFRNVGGSFYEFTAELRRGARTEVLAEPPDEWGGRAAVEWAERLAAGSGFDPSVESCAVVAEILDSMYERSTLDGS